MKCSIVVSQLGLLSISLICTLILVDLGSNYIKSNMIIVWTLVAVKSKGSKSKIRGV